MANECCKAIEQYQFVWGTNSFFTRREHRRSCRSRALQRRITQILSAADAACYAAKDQGRNRVHVYREDDTAVVRRHGEMQWVSRVKRALTENRFFLEAQPIMPLGGDEATRRTTSCWYGCATRTIGACPPGAFMPSVDRYNLASRLDRWVISAAFSWLKRNLSNLRDVERFFINLSGDTLGDRELAHYIVQGLRRVGHFAGAHRLRDH